MSTYRLYTFAFLLCFAAGIVIPAHAAEHIYFENSKTSTANFKINTYLEKTRKVSPRDMLTARIDLNEDGISEYIIKPANCVNAGMNCTHDILAENEDGIVRLGTIKARNLVLGSTYSHGIRDIKAYNNPDNDFDHQLYVWEPARARYTIASGGKNKGNAGNAD